MTRREEMRRLLVRRERQGLTFQELSEQSGIPAGTLAFWSWKLRQGTGRIPAKARDRGGFVELVATRTQDSSDATSSLEIVLANGRHVVVHGEVDEARVLRVVAALERC